MTEAKQKMMIDKKTEEQAIRFINEYFENRKPGGYIDKSFLEIKMPGVNVKSLIDTLVAHEYITYDKTTYNEEPHIKRCPSCITYFLDKEESRKQQLSQYKHDWMIAIFSALAGALLSEPLWTILRAIFSTSAT